MTVDEVVTYLSDDTHDSESESDYDLGYRFGTAHLASALRERTFMRLLITISERPISNFGHGFRMALREGLVAHLERLTPVPTTEPKEDGA